MGLLNDIIKKQQQGRICETCGNLILASKIKLNEVPMNLTGKALGCIAHDKLIMPEYLPYNGNCECKDWIEPNDTSNNPYISNHPS